MTNGHTAHPPGRQNREELAWQNNFAIIWGDKMPMTYYEIAASYRQAKDREAQISILADLNDCDRQTIREILVEEGETVKPCYADGLQGLVKQLRLERGLTMSQFAKMAGIGLSTLCEFESGATPSKKTVKGVETAVKKLRRIKPSPKTQDNT